MQGNSMAGEKRETRARAYRREEIKTRRRRETRNRGGKRRNARVRRDCDDEEEVRREEGTVVEHRA